MIVVYRTPADPAAFEKHYFETHVPLAKQLPGLRSYEVSRGTVAVLASAIGAQCAADRKLLAPDEDVQTFLFEQADV